MTRTEMDLKTWFTHHEPPGMAAGPTEFTENPDVHICPFHVQESLEICETCSAM